MKRTAVLRWSLLASLGLLPLACGADDDDDSGGAAGKGGSGGTAGKGGSGGSGGTAGKGGKGGSGGSMAGQAGTDTGGGGAGGVPARPPSCTNPKTDASGLIKCEEGYRYRGKAQTCDYRADEGPHSSGGGGQGGGGGAGAAGASGGIGGAAQSNCEEACEGEHAFCRRSGVIPVGYQCAQGCLTDAECGDDSFCLCDGALGGFCAPSNCRSDADCDDGYHCAESESICQSTVGFFACQTPEDECLTRAECDGQACTFDNFVESDRRTCSDAVCGRPFLVEAAARVAPVTPRTDWKELGLAPRVDHLSPAERAEQAAHWSKLGQMEHASIAAFARFQLQLLALGAPSALVQACNQALVDETAHTRLCFALASAYAGRGVGPGPLDIDHSLDVTSLADIVELVLVEGCIGETSAALEALEAGESATDPVIQNAYARIAADEQRHAELAYRFVAWALEQGDAEVARRVEAAIHALPNTAMNLEVVRPCLLALTSALPAAA